MLYRKYKTSEKKKRLMKRKMGSIDFENDHFKNSLDDIDFKELNFEIDYAKISESLNTELFKDDFDEFFQELEKMINKRTEYYNFDFDNLRKNLFDVLNVINDIIFDLFEIDDKKKIFIVKNTLNSKYTLILDFYEVLLYIVEYLNLETKILTEIFKIMNPDVLDIFKNTINKSLKN